MIPSIVLINHYRNTRILDYLLFAGFFIFGAMVRVIRIWGNANNLFLYQLTWLFADVGSLLLFFHAIRIRWVKPPRLIFFSGLLWVAFLVYFILSWEILTQLGDREVIFWKMQSTPYEDPPGAGFIAANGNIIYSTHYPILGTMFRVYIGVLLTYSYSTISLVHPTNKIIQARKLFMYTSLIWFLSYTMTLPWINYIRFLDFTLSIGMILILYIFFIIPEGVLLSHAQITRASKLYDKVQNITPTRNLKNFGFNSIIEYINSLPSEYLQGRRELTDN